MFFLFNSELKSDPKKLVLSWMNGKNLTLDEWKIKLSNITSDIEELDLSANNLGSVELTYLKGLLSFIHRPIEKINFSFNALYKLDENSLKDLMSVFPKCNTLDLSHNRLNQFSKEGIIAALRNLPLEIQFINLSRNNLDALGFNDETLNTENLGKKIQLIGNEFENLSANEMSS